MPVVTHLDAEPGSCWDALVLDQDEDNQKQKKRAQAGREKDTQLEIKHEETSSRGHHRIA